MKRMMQVMASMAKKAADVGENTICYVILHQPEMPEQLLKNKK